MYVLNTDREKTKCPPKSVDQIVASSFQILKHNVFRASKKEQLWVNYSVDVNLATNFQPEQPKEHEN